jgi:hypothetical protein
VKKIDEISNPGSCLLRAKMTEPLFVLIGRDVAAPATIRAWVEERLRHGKNQATDPQITEALELAREMESYRAAFAHARGEK